MWPVILYPVGLCCMIISYFGFSFYLWYLSCSPDHVQNSLLNILYGYMSLVCMGGGLTAITIIILLAFPEGLGRDVDSDVLPQPVILLLLTKI